MNWLDEIKWTDDGLVPVITQEAGTGKVLMMAWMNREALTKTAELGQAVYCDADVILLCVEQLGGIACHTGRHNCFYRSLQNGEWVTVDPVLKDPDQIYK